VLTVRSTKPLHLHESIRISQMGHAGTSRLAGQVDCLTKSVPDDEVDVLRGLFIVVV
jgi:hypothetical protein